MIVFNLPSLPFHSDFIGRFTFQLLNNNEGKYRFIETKILGFVIIERFVKNPKIIISINFFIKRIGLKSTIHSRIYAGFTKQ